MNYILIQSLLISGGHTVIVLVKDSETFLRFGETSNLAVGNCMDKVARRLGLYNLDKNDLSGGALIEKYAANGDEEKFKIFKNIIKNYCGKNKDCNFSFGGLYASVNFMINKLEKKEILNEKIISTILKKFV